MIPSEEELIARLNQGNFSEEEMDELIEQMQKRGMSGSIMAVASEEEAQVAREYVEYHPKVPAMVHQDEVERVKVVLLNKESSIEEKKRAMVILAHVGRLDVFKTLEKYAQDPDEELRLWINMALQECESFLKADIMDEPVVSFSRVSKTGRNEPCPVESPARDGH